MQHCAGAWSTCRAGRGRAARGGEGLRALRFLPARLPDLPAVGRGDGLPAGPDLPGEPASRRGPAERRRRRALRPLPGLHGLHDRLPVRGAVRPDHRGGAGVDRGSTVRGRRRREPPGRPRPRSRGARGRWRGVRCAGPVPDVPTAPPRPVRDRATRAAIFALFPYPERLRAATAPLRAAQRTGPDRRLARTGLPGRVSPALGAGAAAGAAGAAAAAARPLPERVAARGHPAGRGRHAHRLRPVGVLPAGQRGDRAGARRRGLRRDHPARAGLLRRAVAALRPGGRGRGVRAAHDRDVRAGRRRRDRRQLGRVRLGDEGVRAAAARTPPAAGPAGGGAVGKVRDLAEFLAELGPVARRHPLPVTAAYHDACHLGHAQRITRRPARCCGPSPGWSWWSCGTRAPAAARRASTTCCSRRPRANSAPARPNRCWPPGASLLISANPGCTLQISSALAERGQDIAVAHTAEVLDASIRGRAL